MPTNNAFLNEDISALKLKCVAFRNTRSNCKTPYPDDVVNTVIAIVAQGYSLSELAQRTGISLSAIHRWKSERFTSEIIEPRKLRVVEYTNACSTMEEVPAKKRPSRCKIQVFNNISIFIATDDVTIQLIKVLQEATNAR